ncbi:hypothetical protein SASPL_103335 [Salvia splendens]|uniref:Protein kinase domain-containing protein n=1 Tax=Salvia splendens TaxID=180675 RepID=A0A8X8YYL4_SALSN|nr:hypothetical protein SASPL_103335 [Salvia splendens]
MLATFKKPLISKLPTVGINFPEALIDTRRGQTIKELLRLDIHKKTQDDSSSNYFANRNLNRAKLIWSQSRKQSSHSNNFYAFCAHLTSLKRLEARKNNNKAVALQQHERIITKGEIMLFEFVFFFYSGPQSATDMEKLSELNEFKERYFTNSKSIACSNIQVLIGGFETKTGEQWLAFRNDGKYTAAGYAQVASEKMTKYSDVGGQAFWNPFEKSETIKRRRYFITKLLQGAIRGLAYMHDHERLHQSLGPSSVALNTIAEKDAAYLVPRLRDLAFSVDIRFSELNGNSNPLSEGLWRRASAAGASTPMEKRAFGIADDIYEAGLLFAYLSFIPFCAAGVMDSLSLRRLFENTFQLDIQAMREYCLADDRLVEAVKFLDLGDGAGWELLQAMMNRDYRQRPIAEAVLNHRFLAGAFL